MPWIEVGEVLLDPFVAGEAFSVVRRKEDITRFGRSQTTNTTLTEYLGFPIVGSISPSSNQLFQKLYRLDSSQLRNKAIQVITSFPLRGPDEAAGSNFQPDVVLWHGNQYVVSFIDDYSAYGGGMIKADCISMDLIDNAAPPGNVL